jgi:hydroxypyruvate reductase
VPLAAREHLEAGRRGDVPEGLTGERPGDRARLLFGLGALVAAAAAAARARGFTPIVLAERLEGEVGAVAEILSGQILGLESGGRHILVAGGEPTVVLPAEPGEGGRAQQLALLLARALRGRGDLTVLCAGSDGVDGNSPAAGAVVDGRTWDAIAGCGLDPAAHLATCDAGPALAAARARIETGPTGVNHADLVLACWESEERRKLAPDQGACD